MRFLFAMLRARVRAAALETEFPKALRDSVAAELEFVGRTHQRTRASFRARKLRVRVDPRTAHDAPRRLQFPEAWTLRRVNRPVVRAAATTRLHVRVRSAPQRPAARAGR